MDKAQEKIGQLVYGVIIGGLALGGLLIVAKEKVLDKIKKI